MPSPGTVAGVPAGAIREQVRAIAASKPFARSERLRAFLSFVVEETLAGRGGELKEYAIAADVFDRSATYDSGSDALVRVEARRLRRKLADYYQNEGSEAAIIIEVPTGSYQPVFQSRNSALRTGRDRWWWAAAALLVAAAIVSSAIQLRNRAADPLSFGSDARARELYWQGVYLGREPSEANLRKSAELFEQAVARQPGSARARAALSVSYAWMAFFHVGPWREADRKARATANEALRRDPRMGEAWEALALVETFKAWNWGRAEESFRRALAAEPNDAAAHRSYALALAAHGRFGEAMEHAQRALEADPSSFVANNDVSVALYCARRFQDAGARARQTETVRPKWAPAYVMAGMREAAQGRLPQAAAELRKAVDLSRGDPYCLGRLGNALARSGNRDEAAGMAALLEKQAGREWVPHLNRAWPYIALSDRERALAHIEAAIPDRETDLLFLGADAIYDPLRQEPRFRAVLRRLGLAK